MNNREVVEKFNTIADMLSIRGDTIHRVLAYRRAAESVQSLGRDINQVFADGELTEIPGIGSTLAAKIEELLTTGELEFYERLSQEVPPALVDLLRVEGLGPKRVKQLYDAQGISNLEELTAAARAGKLRELPGMGAKSEARILAAIEALARHGDARTPLGDAWPVAQAMVKALAALPEVTQATVGGSLRRMRETIGDVDLLVAASEAEPVMEAFCSLANVEAVVARGPTKSRVVLLNGLGVDLRVLPAERWGTLLSYFTGSKDHNVRLRELAHKIGWSLNEHAFIPYGNGQESEILCATEAEVYQVLGLPTIPPTLREDRGEIEAAASGRLPQLVQAEDIVGDLHVHSTWSDGKLSILEMAQAAKERGRQFIVVTDHSFSLGIANGLTEERLRAQAAAVQQADELMGPEFRVLHGTEMEVRADGSLDFSDEALAELDFVIASVHTSLRQPRDQIMARFMAAIRNPHVDMIAHPSGRLLPDRAGADLDMDAILDEARATDTILEINANPQRLDLTDIYARRAMDLGVRLAINTDAHHPDHFDFLHYGVATAQRGWVTAANVVNTWPAAALMDYVARRS